MRQVTATPYWQNPQWRYDGNPMWVFAPFIVGWHFPKGSAWPWRHFGAAWRTHMCMVRPHGAPPLHGNYAILHRAHVHFEGQNRIKVGRRLPRRPR